MYAHSNPTGSFNGGARKVSQFRCARWTSGPAGWAREDAEGSTPRRWRSYETVVTIRFAGGGPKTRLTLHQAVFESTTARDQHQGGWSECLDRPPGYRDDADR
jgi:hypothetical protein